MAFVLERRFLDRLTSDNGRIVVLGAGGQLGNALTRILGEQCLALSRKEADFSQPNAVVEAVAALKPSAVINAAAYTQVDKAETEEELATLINGETPGAVARLCADLSVPFLHVSTDYVFTGEGETPWTPSSPVSPLNAYGRTKLFGERAVAQHGGKFLTFRTSWVYDAQGKNFFRTMVRLGEERETLKVVGDQIGAPTYAPHLATGMLLALHSALSRPDFPSGVYHMCGSGFTSWHGFASAIFSDLRKAGVGGKLKVKAPEKIASSEFPTPARRPKNSRLDMSATRATFGVTMPDWTVGLNECVQEWKSTHGTQQS